jgi:hypothetical protein
MTIQEVLTNKKFAGYVETIKHLYIIDDDFKILCDDYCISIVNNEELKKELNKDRQLAREYEDLSTELEKEILQYILNVR